MVRLKDFIIGKFNNYKLTSVKINEGAIEDFKFNKKEFYLTNIKFKQKIKNIKNLGNFIFILRILDFRLWEFPENWKYKNEKGFWGLMERVKDLFEFTDNLKKLRFYDFKKIISPKESISLAFLRYKLFKEGLNWLYKNYQMNFDNYFEENKEPLNFCLNLTQLKKFKDHNKDLHFLKPNQLLYYEYILAKNLENKFEAELNELTIFADYKIPSILINMDFLKVNGKDLHRIKTKIIKKGSKLENELRIASIIVGEMLSEKFKVPAYIIDNILWSLSYKTKLKVPPPRIKTIHY